jgi:hypothetical protein
MLEEITYFPIFGLPFIVYLGIITLFIFLFAAMIASLTKRGINKVNFKWHSRLAKIGILLAIIHGTLGVLASF